LDTISKSSNNISLWIAASAVLLNLSKYADTLPALANDKVKKTVDEMYSSSHPLGQLMAAQIETLFLANNSVHFLFAGARPKTLLDILTSIPSRAAVVNAISSVIPPEPQPRNPPDAMLRGDALLNLNALWRPLAFGVLANIWGGIRWRIAGRLGGLKGQDLKKFVKKQNKTGRYVFSLLMLDPITQLLMAWPEDGIRVPFTDATLNIPQRPFGYPLHTLLPIDESFLFIAAGLYALRYQRFVVLPMVAAMTTAHWDEIHEFTKPYENAVGLGSLRSYIWDSATKWYNEQMNNNKK